MKTWDNLDSNVAKATMKYPENSDIIRIWVLLSEILGYKCNQQCFNGVKCEMHIQNITFHGQWSHGGLWSRFLWCPWIFFLVFEKAHKLKLGKWNVETKKAGTNNTKTADLQTN